MTGTPSANVHRHLIPSGVPPTKRRSRHSDYFWCFLSSLISFFPAGHLLGAESSPGPVAAQDLEGLIPDAPVFWSRDINARVSAGYNDNLVQDSARSERSLALGAGLEATVLRLPLDGRQLLFTFTGDYTHYPNGERVEHEAFFLGFSQLKLDLSPRWQAAFDLQYLFLDQVIDTSITETNLSAAPVRAHGLTARPSIRADLPRSFWIEVGIGTTRQFLDQPFDDYWEGGPRLVLGHDYGHRSSVALSYEWKQRVYDTREEASFHGTNFPGSELQFQIHEVELAWRHNWDERRRWRSVTRLGLLANHDSGSGFFDYRRYQASQQLRYVAQAWEVKAQAKVAYYDFAHQAADSGASEDRTKTALGLTLRGERQLVKHLKLFAEYTFEESLSNRAADEYRVNKVAGGIDCGF